MPFRHSFRHRVGYSLAGALPLLVTFVMPPQLHAQESGVDPGPGSTSPSTSSSTSTSTSTGADTEAPRGFFTEPSFIGRGISLGLDKLGDKYTEPKNGFYPELSNMITGSGWISVGPGYRQDVLGNRAFVDLSAAVSWNLYNMAQVRFEAPRLASNKLTLGTQEMWRDETQVNYFGAGPGALKTNWSQYRLKSTDFVGYARFRPIEWLSIGDELGWLYRPTIENPGGLFISQPSTLLLFPNQPGLGSSIQPSFLHNQISVAADSRDYPSHVTSGGLYQVAVTNYLDRSSGMFSFTEYEAEALQVVPLDVDKRWVLGLRGWAVLSSVPAGHQIPIYLEPAIGGQNTLRSYENFMFHDSDLLVVNAESRWSLFTHVDGALFLDAGSVAGRASDLNLSTTSVGAGIRLHTKHVTIVRFDAAHGAQGWGFFLRTDDPFRLGRVQRRIAYVPFAP